MSVSGDDDFPAPDGDLSRNRSCPHCGREILAKALQCRHCRKWMPELFEARPDASARPEDADAGGAGAPASRVGAESVSRAQSPAHFLILSLLTLGLYELYWFWRNWRDLRDAFALPLSPGWRTAGLLVPFLNVYLVYDCVRLVHESAGAHGVAPSFRPAAVAAAFFLIALAGNLTLLWAVSLLNVFPLVPVQETLNRLWSRLQPSARPRDRLSPAEKAALAAGALLTAGALAYTLP